jgi:hypothetical protein
VNGVAGAGAVINRYGWSGWRANFPECRLLARVNYNHLIKGVTLKGTWAEEAS